MTKKPSPISELLHHRARNLSKGAPVSLPIMASTTFLLPGDPDGSHFYARNGNPTVESVEAEIGILENAETVLFPSGMAAIAAMFHTVLRPGDKVLVHADGYYNVRALLNEHFRASKFATSRLWLIGQNQPEPCWWLITRLQHPCASNLSILGRIWS